ncbi:MAG TPA: RNA polymerase sigma-70 factor [Chitinophaga sp.]|uniref:RNA polymerase sigma factor n=1 Tax=Chitinophaga sp. TaxID=1869181 RepID=UPI002BA65A89|nr:RNA polymerase sigma-70 factor [Chitinophaga sp.]HVI43929.1 RNA polymerase sigma-70 factor [Chitinophaga sp.]
MSSSLSHTDEQLFALLQSGDEAAFNLLYDRYWKRLLVRAHVLLNNHEDAEELVHDIFVQLWRKRGHIVLRHTFHTYVAAMLQYGCFKVLANRKRNKQHELTLTEKERPDLSTEQYLDFEFLRDQLEAAIGTLPEKCRLVFRLSREGGFSDKEIASQLNLSVNTVRTQMNRALQKLKVALHTSCFF